MRQQIASHPSRFNEIKVDERKKKLSNLKRQKRTKKQKFVNLFFICRGFFFFILLLEDKSFLGKLYTLTTVLWYTKYVMLLKVFVILVDSVL